MVRAWYLAPLKEDDDHTLEHQMDPPREVSLEELEKLGLSYYIIDADKDETWDKLREEKGHRYEDELTLSKETLGDKYEPLLETFYKEHFHEYDEIRYVQDGSGYFDIRDKNDQWIRVEVTKGDMLIEPAGLYHRFSMDSKDYIKAGRFFTGVPVWTPLYRPEAETHPTRVAYLKSQQKQA